MQCKVSMIHLPIILTSTMRYLIYSIAKILVRFSASFWLAIVYHQWDSVSCTHQKPAGQILGDYDTSFSRWNLAKDLADVSAWWCTNLHVQAAKRSQKILPIFFYQWWRQEYLSCNIVNSFTSSWLFNLLVFFYHRNSLFRLELTTLQLLSAQNDVSNFVTNCSHHSGLSSRAKFLEFSLCSWM